MKTTKKKTKNEMTYSWTPYIKAFHNDFWYVYSNYMSEVNDYLQINTETLQITPRKHMRDLIALLKKFKEQTGYFETNTVKKICQAMYTLREKNRDDKELDPLVQTFTKKSRYVLEELVEYYFCDNEDLEFLISLMEDETLVDKLLDTVLTRMEKRGDSKENRIKMCLQYPTMDVAYKYIYQECKEDPKQCLQLLKQCDQAFQKENTTSSDLSLYLLEMQGKIKKITPYDPYFKRYMNLTRSNYPAAFQIMKNSMSIEEWKRIGKPCIKEYVQVRDSEYYDMLQKLDCPDLLIDSFVENGFTDGQLDTYHDFIYAYDPGLCYFFYEFVILNRMDRYNFVDGFFYLYDRFLHDKEANHALKIICASMKGKIRDPHKIEKLNELEETAYEQFEEYETNEYFE